MKILIDTNIFLDLLLKRNFYKEALEILNNLDKYEVLIVDITLLNIDYIAKKQIKEIREFLNLVNNTCQIKGAENEDLKKALDIENNDLEDNLQYVVAEKYECECIVTNDKGFKFDNIEILTSKQFVKKYL